MRPAPTRTRTARDRSKLRALAHQAARGLAVAQHLKIAPVAVVLHPRWSPIYEQVKQSRRPDGTFWRNLRVLFSDAVPRNTVRVSLTEPPAVAS